MKAAHQKVMILGTLLLSICYINNVFSLEYQFTNEIEFNINPSISLSVDGDLAIPNLSPGSGSDSNIITVNASSNAVAGYVLYSTAGDNETYAGYNTDLRLSSSNATNIFSNLQTNKATLSDFDSSSNTWGYSYSTDSGTTWISGDYDNYNTGYNGLPLYTNTGIKLAETTDDTSTSTIKFKIGARATNNQVAGTYQNVVNFYAVTNPSPTSLYDSFALNGKTKYNGYYKMQDMTSDICEDAAVGSNAPLIDIRDNQLYNIAKLVDNNCWMIDNLNLGDIDNYPLIINNLSSTNTNISNIIPAVEFKNWQKSEGTNNYYTPEYISSPGFDEVSKSNYGTLYNYCAASANTRCLSIGELSDAEYDICPTNWRLPTGGSNGEFQNLYALSGGNKIHISIYDGGAAFALAGTFINGAPYNQGALGYYWSSTYESGNSMHDMVVVSSYAAPSTSDGLGRGNSIRCIAK